MSNVLLNVIYTLLHNKTYKNGGINAGEKHYLTSQPVVNICSVKFFHYTHFIHFLFNTPRCRGFNAGFTHLQLSHRTSFSLLTILFFYTQFHISIPFILLALVKNTRTEETSNNCPPGWPRLFNSIAAL